MSTIISRATSLRPITQHNIDDKHRLIRTSSMDKIKRFNSFICAQQYIVLPALLAWLKCSQSGLQSSTEYTIHLFRSIIFNNIIYKHISMNLKVAETWRSEQYSIVSKKYVKCDIASISQMLAEFCDALVLLAIVVYMSFIVVILQLCYLLYTIYISWIPSGFIFLLGCMLIINYLFYKTAHFYVFNKVHIK